jgi:UPF0716 family protein affecting phage T7 exclusion
MVFIDGTVVNVALPALQRQLAASLADVQWVVESYALFLAALKLGTPVFLGTLIGFFLYKPALVLLVAWDILRHTNRQ